jgi:HlyD family secretion protein
MKKILFLAFLALAACKKSEGGKADLPPATGEGAPALPEIPDLKATTVDAGTGAGSASTPAAPSDAHINGTLAARADVKVGPKTSGTIVSLSVDEGAHVKKGDLLFRLDTSDAQLMRRTASTAMSAAKLELAAAQREYDRMARLVAENAMPRAQLDQLQTALDGAKVSISMAKNSMAMANKLINDATVRSPSSGVVLQRLMSVGEYATMMPPSPVYVLQDQSKLELKFPVPERQITTIKIGDEVTATIGALGQTRTAKVSQIAPMVNAQTRTIEITAIVDNCDEKLVPGMMAEVKLGADAGAEITELACAAPAPAKKPAKGKAPAARKAPPLKGKPS